MELLKWNFSIAASHTHTHTHTHIDSISLDKLHGGGSLPYLVVLLVTVSHSFKIFEADTPAVKSLMSGPYTTKYVLYTYSLYVA